MMKYVLEVLVNEVDNQYGSNAIFKFEKFDEMIDVELICLRNGYEVRIGTTEV